MSGISTHILDLATGKPAAGVPVRLELLDAGTWHPLTTQVTDADGRCRELLPQGAVSADCYRLIFNTGAYFTGQPLYPEVIITFRIAEPGMNYHMPLLLSPNGYTTYRGS
jgi:5-hydroxyisourate hydrolase